MAARAMLVRPAALCSPTFSFLCRTITTTTTTYRPSFLTAKRTFFTSRPINIRRAFSIRATTTTPQDSNNFQSPLMESMENKIKEHLSAESVIVKDAYGDGRHVSIEVVSSAFEGQSAVNRQRMVYKAIWEELQDKVHAVDQMTTRTPAEVAKSS